MLILPDPAGVFAPVPLSTAAARFVCESTLRGVGAADGRVEPLERRTESRTSQRSSSVCSSNGSKLLLTVPEKRTASWRCEGDELAWMMSAKRNKLGE